MNKVVVKHNIPASELPEHLRGEIPLSARVTVTVSEEENADGKSLDDLRRMIEEYQNSPSFRPVTEEEAVRRIRELRDDWDD